MKVLVADDDPVSLIVVRDYLKKWGYEVVEVTDGAEALKECQKDDPPRIAILDWMMPNLDGVSVCQKLIETPPKKFIFTILLTCKTQKEDLAFALHHGAHEFQAKPTDPVELQARLAVANRLIAAEDKLKEYTFHLEDLAEARAQEIVQQRHLARTDSLTEIYNRRHLEELAMFEFTQARSHQFQLSVLMIDIDNFKKINDTYGHAVGDGVIKSLAMICKRFLRQQDHLGRMGGEEFAVILPQTNPEEALLAAERLRETISNFIVPFKDDMISITVSIGISSLQEDDPHVETLFKRADQALYEAKNKGRNLVIFK